MRNHLEKILDGHLRHPEFAGFARAATADGFGATVGLVGMSAVHVNVCHAGCRSDFVSHVFPFHCAGYGINS